MRSVCIPYDSMIEEIGEKKENIKMKSGSRSQGRERDLCKTQKLKKTHA